MAAAAAAATTPIAFQCHLALDSFTAAMDCIR